MKVLMAITTANQASFTKVCLVGLTADLPNQITPVIFDDASADETVRVAQSFDIEFVTKERPHGLTHSWNLAYQRFLSGGFDYLILSNNDIVIPRNALRTFLDDLRPEILLGPLTTRSGLGGGLKYCPEQQLELVFPSCPIKASPSTASDVQEYVQGRGKATKVAKVLPEINGFFFGFGRPIEAHAYAPGALFDSRKVNIGNELELMRRVPFIKVVSTRTFIWHFRGASFVEYPKGTSRNVIWDQAAKRAPETA